MFEIIQKYAASTNESQKALYAGAGESMLARFEHGSLGVFIGFLLRNIAGLILSFVIFKVSNKLKIYILN